MPNGINDKKELARLEKDLILLDDELKKFVANGVYNLSKNYHYNPERSISWFNKFHRKLQISPIELGGKEYQIWLVAFHDVGRYRYMKSNYYKKGVTIDTLQLHLIEYLNDCVSILNSWSESELKKTTIIEEVPPGFENILD